MADQLAIWNVALAHLGQRRLATLQDPNESARVLGDEWDAAVRGSLEMAVWSFATRAVTLNPAGGGSYGFANAFTKPADWLRSANLGADAALTVPLAGYIDEGASWFADEAAISVRYVSSDTNFGYNVGGWTQPFADLVSLVLAARACRRLTGSDEVLAELLKLREQAMSVALAYENATQQRQYAPRSTAGAARLQIYNAALRYLGQGRIATLTETGSVVRALNDAWFDAIFWALSQGPWTWSIRGVMIGPQPDVTPTFGFANAFEKPADWLQTVAISEFDDFRAGATAYADETGWWFSGAPGLFVRYVSTGPNYGLCLDRWPPAFNDLVAARLAELIGANLSMSAAQIAGLAAVRERAMKTLRATDALNTPPVFPPEGSWVAARRGSNRAGRRWGSGPGGPAIPATGDTTLTADTDLPVNTDIIPRISG